MMKNKFFEVADIQSNKGQLIIDSTAISTYHKHYNVEIEISPDGWIKVTGEASQLGLSLDTGTYDINEITDDSIIEYKPWPWSKTKKKKSNNVVEFKKRIKKTYTSNSWQIIEK